jgi:hypothetical protein
MARLAEPRDIRFGAVTRGILSGSGRGAKDGNIRPGASGAELTHHRERNHFRNHLSETRGDGPTRPVTVSPWSRSFLRRRFDPSIVFTRFFAVNPWSALEPSAPAEEANMLLERE